MGWDWVVAFGVTPCWQCLAACVPLRNRDSGRHKSHLAVMQCPSVAPLQDPRPHQSGHNMQVGSLLSISLSLCETYYIKISGLSELAVSLALFHTCFCSCALSPALCHDT